MREVFLGETGKGEWGAGQGRGRSQTMPFQASSQSQRGSSGVYIMPSSHLDVRSENWAFAPLRPQSPVTGCPGGDVQAEAPPAA